MSVNRLAPAVEVSDLTYKYGERLALGGIGFEVSAGQMFALVGPNGGGKSTTFKILSTLLKPTSGFVQIVGHDVAREPQVARRALGVVFQSPALDKKLTVGENLTHQGHLYGLRGKVLRARIAELLVRLGLLDRRNERTETLSGGLKRRVEIAKGLLHRPEILILDEPTTGLDPLARREVWNYLQELRRQEGITVLTTTHLLEEAEACSQVVFLDLGKIVASGTPAELRRQLGGDVISLSSAEPEALRSQIEIKFRLKATLVENQVRIERESGHEFIPELVMAFPESIKSVTVSKPTLEDLFIEKTGRRFAQPAVEKLG